MIAYVTRTYTGRRELWVVAIDAPRDHVGVAPTYPALFATYGGEVLGYVPMCKLGRTFLNLKENNAREGAATVHSALVRRAEAELTSLDDIGDGQPCSTRWTGSTPRWT